MLIERDYLSNVAGELLSFLYKKIINSLTDLDKIMNQQFALYDNRFIHVEMSPSNSETYARTVSYIVNDEVGIPLEFKINEDLGYSQIIVKGDFVITGYGPFAQDAFLNTIQNKVLESAEFSSIIEELELLRDGVDDYEIPEKPELN